jgi:outer membrane lipoprotein-sorting protein
VPAGVAAVVAVVSLAPKAQADDHPVLAARTAAELLAAVAGTTPPPGISGTVSETVDLGLPSLPSMGGNSGAGTLSLLSLATGTHTVRVWAAGPAQQRVALLGQLAETEFVHNGADVWTYASSTHEVTHATVGAAGAATAPDPSSVAQTPQSIAAAALAAVYPSTVVTVDSTATVAGRPAYRLVLTPRDTRTLVGSVRIAIDAQTSVPLQVQVFAKNQFAAAIDVGFTSVSFAPVDASVFAFTPPAGATVTERTQAADGTGAAGTPQPRDTPRGAATHPRVLGTGWTSVVSTTMPTSSPTSTGDAAASSQQLLDQLSTPVAGGRVITTALVTVFLADDGTVYAGAVSAADLEQVATSGRGL